MHTNLRRLPKSWLSLAIATAISGCANLPSHDGSLRTVYGMDKTKPADRYARVEEQTTPVVSDATQPDNTTAVTDLPADADTPVVRTLNNGASIVSQPIDRRYPLTDKQLSGNNAQTPMQADPVVAADDTPVDAAPLAAPMEVAMADSASQADVVTMADTDFSALDAAPADAAQGVSTHTVNNTDSLSSIAKQYTGDAGNWKRIAEYNQLPKPYTIRVGDELMIPAQLPTTENDKQGTTLTANLPFRIVSPTRQENTQATAQQATAPRADVPDAAEPEIPMAAILGQDDQDDYIALTSTPANEQEQLAMADTPVEPVAQEETQVGGLRGKLNSFTAMVKAGFKKPTVEAEADIESKEATPTAAKDGTPQVKVTGNFTPKAVYKAADYASGLLMRVAPGTVFETTGQEGDWVAIETNEGTGYIFHRDVQPAD
jgi:LysM repeat protein